MSRQVNPQGRADRRLRLEQLRVELARLDRSDRAGLGPVLPFGLAAIDRILPGGGLARGALHELCGAPEHGAAAGFAATLLGRLAAGGHVVWIGPRDELFAPGLKELGVEPARLIVVRAHPHDVRLWALEEALRSPGPAAALAEIDRLTLSQSRRLQLAAEAKGVTALLLRPTGAAATPSAAFTRWRVEALPSAGEVRQAPGPPRWQLELIRARGGQSGAWQIEWREGGWHEIAGALALAAEPSDRAADRAREA